MDYLSIEDDIRRISFGGEFVLVKNEDGIDKVFIIKPPALGDKEFINAMCIHAKEEGQSAGLLSTIEMYSSLKVRNIWTSDDDEAIESLQIQFNELSKRMDDENKRIARIAKNKIKSVASRLSKYVSKKRNLMGQTLNDYVNEVRFRATIFCCTYDEKSKRYWETWDDFQNESDMNLIAAISKMVSKFKQIDAKRIRRIARSSQWRFRWNAAKGIGDLFGIPIVFLNQEQQSLIYWSQVYDSVYESMERPGDDVIEDDEKLDKWFKDQDRKRKVKNIEKGTQGVGSTNLSSSVSRHGEIFVITNRAINPDAPSRTDVDELNTELTKNFKRQEQKKIKRHGILNEKDLRDRNNKIARKMIGSSDALIKPNKFGQGKSGNSKRTEGGTY